MTYDLIIPSTLETATTGFIVGAKKTMYRNRYIIRVKRIDDTVTYMMYKNGIGLVGIVDKNYLVKWLNEFLASTIVQGLIKHA